MSHPSIGRVLSALESLRLSAELAEHRLRQLDPEDAAGREDARRTCEALLEDLEGDIKTLRAGIAAHLGGTR